MAVELSEAARQAIAEAAGAGYPHEVCGILLGTQDEGVHRISQTLAIQNSFEEAERGRRYLITPADFLLAERHASKVGLDVLGVYHSHPDDEGVPSEYDRDHAAWTTWSYLIVPVPRGQPATIRAWRLCEDRSSFAEEEVVSTHP